MQIKEDWLKSTKSIIDYRQHLFSAFKDSQKRYLERKAEKKVTNQIESMVPMNKTEDFYTVDPKIQSLALQKRKMIKESRGALRRKIERYFVIDNFLITFFKTEGDIDFKKNASLDQAFVLVEGIDEESTFQWHERGYEYRVQIRLPARQVQPIFFYTNDLNEAKMVAARVYMGSSMKREQISQLIRKISFFESIFRFRTIWQRIFKVYESRLLKMISFQIMGINLIELANTAWFQREKLFKYWSGQILKREKIPLLRSTFRFGEIKKRLDPNLYKSSLMVREQLRRLINAFKNRRLQRHSAIQQDIYTLLEEEENGSPCSQVVIKLFNNPGGDPQITKMDQANMKVEKNTFFSLQRQGDGKMTAEFFEKNPPIKFQLEHIAALATDCVTYDKSQDKYRLRIYGRCTSEAKDPSSATSLNMSPHELGLDVMRRASKELYEIKIISIEMPIQLAQRFSLKADVRVKLKQSRGSQESFDERCFYINSRPYRISVPPEKQKGRMVLRGYDFTFLVDKLDPANPDEEFQLSIVLQRNSVPVSQFMKEFLFEEEFFAKKFFKYENASDKLDVKVSDGQGNKMKVVFSIKKQSKSDYPHEREGVRLHIGRYALYRRKIVIIKSIQNNENVVVQFLHKPEKVETVQLKRLNLIERQGVNVFDINKLPYSIDKSNYQWIIDITSNNKRFINSLTSGIQNRQIKNSFDQRSFYREKKRDIEGKILISVIECMNIKLNKCNAYFKITVFNEADNQHMEYISSVIENTSTPSWVTEQNPSGEIVDIGMFFKEEQCTITFQVFNKGTSSDTLMGEVTVPSEYFIDIDEPGKEKCLILEDPKKQSYIFLVVQSLFVSNNVTRIEYQLVKDLSIYISPEEYFHYQYLLKQYELDNFQYQIPLSRFLPNYLEKLTHAENEGQNNLKQSLGIKTFKSPMLFDSANQPDKTCSPGLTFLRRKICSPEEKTSLALRNQNFLRPEIEEGVLIFKYLWKYRVFIARQQSYMDLQDRFWERFLADMEKYAQSNPFVLQIKDDENHMDQSFEKTSHISQNIQNRGNLIIDWFKQKDSNAQAQDARQSQAQAIVQTKRFNLMFNKIWENETGQMYADTYYLINSGIPNGPRVKIWKDLLKTEVLEFEEQRLFSKDYPDDYDESKSMYQNFKDFASRHDCLAFRQIDEDIEYFRFPRLYHENTIPDLKVVEYNEQKRKMRNILRVLVLWSRNKKLDKEIISYSYTKGMLHILQRLITIATEEDAFWILNSMVRQIPRLFSTEVSCLEGGRNSVMRNEMTAFKAILRENLPLICDKLKLLGLPVDHLIYDSMTSFYANFFSSDVVLRLWDQIIFNLSNNDKVAKKRALWHFMAPAYLILREKKDEIMNGSSIQQVVDIYNNGASLTYNPDWVVSELKTLIKDIFVTGAERFQEAGMSKLSLGFNKLMNRGGGASVDKALLLEQTRKNYEADLSLIFNSIEEENKQIGILLEKTNFMGNYRNPQYLDYFKWRTHVMARFKKVALKHSDDVQDDMFEYDEPELNKDDMDLAKINVYLHQIQYLSSIRLFKMRILYGKLLADLTFQTIEERFSDDVYSDTNINQYQAFEYLKGYNHLKIEIQDNANEDTTVCELIIDMRELNSNKFIKKIYQMKNEYLVENLDSYKYPFTVFVVSFFLQTHTSQQHRELMQSRNTAMSQFINSIKRKLPDRIDIFNKQNETEFVQLMKGDFKRIIKEEFEALQNFLPESQARNTINDNFNFIEDSDFGNITLGNLQYLVKQCFFQDWLPYLGQLYKIFVKEEENKKEEEQEQDQLESENLDDVEDEVPKEEKKSFNVFSKIKQSLLKSNKTENQANNTLNQSKAKQESILKNFQLEGRTTIKQRSKLPFSLRNFIVSLVLMSHCTVNEKFDILYDLFDWNDGVADGLDMNAMFLLIKTIFERNLYYWPSHELFNLVETAFDLSVSSIYQVYWTRENNMHQNKKVIKLKDLLSMQDMKNQDVSTVDVTNEVLENINSYQRMFGNKIIDFNVDSSAFKNIETLIKGGSKMVEITSQIGGKYRLVIFYQVSSERYMFEVEYDKNGLLVKNLDLEEKDDIDEYLKRNINKLYLTGRSKGISKKEFLLKTEQIPFLQDLIRVETFYRDRFQSTLQKKNKLPKELVVLVNEDNLLLIFRFQQRLMANVEGDVQRIDSNTYRILMSDAYEQDVVADIRERIAVVVQRLSQNNKINFEGQDQIEKLLKSLKGVREFFIQDDQNKWKLVNEYDRLMEFTMEKQNHKRVNTSEVIMKMEESKHTGEDKFLSSKEEERDLAAFDCYSLYKHCDLSQEWRLCKIMHKEPSVAEQGVNGILLGGGGAKDLDALSQANQRFYYWIEFLHHRKTGQKLWLKRRREEILMSARYAREQQRNYEQETLKFIRDAYLEVKPPKQTKEVKQQSPQKNIQDEEIIQT